MSFVLLSAQLLFGRDGESGNDWELCHMQALYSEPDTSRDLCFIYFNTVTVREDEGGNNWGLCPISAIMDTWKRA